MAIKTHILEAVMSHYTAERDKALILRYILTIL